MLNKIHKVNFVLVLTTLPILANALLRNTTILIGDIANIINWLIPIAFSLAVVCFFYGVAKFIWGEGQGKDEGKKVMVWGIVGLFVISSVWGIIYLIESELNISSSEIPMQIPKATY